MEFEKSTLFKSLSVSELSRYLRQLIESDEILYDIWVQGEISNVSKPASGHIYFTLKDSKAALKCVIWKSNAYRINIDLREGMAVEVHGGITVYEAGGQYQLNADSVRMRGEGSLYQEFLRVKNLLEMEGLFNPEKKKPIPEAIKRIGLVTSRTGAAIQDMIETIRRRNPTVEIVLSDTAVQGEAAPGQIVNALRKLDDLEFIDVILIARGGGSIEDLWSFNDERVVRAVSECKTPIISGVGHETDFTLTDFAADLRAPTPTAAAELATAVTIADLQDQLNIYISFLDSFIIDLMEQKREEVQNNFTRLLDLSPIRVIQNYWQNLDNTINRLETLNNIKFKMLTTSIINLDKRLTALDPGEVLKRGYAIVTSKNGASIISSIKRVSIGDEYSVRVKDGTFDVNVNSMENK